MFKGYTKLKKLDRAKEMFLEAENTDTYWQREAREDFAFRDGFQWTQEEREIMESEMRPVLTFNLTKSGIDLIMGMNDDTRLRYRCSPVDPSDGFLCDVLNDVSEWVYEHGEFEDEEDETLQSSSICGRGWCAVDFVPDPKRFGDIKLSLLNVAIHEIHFDPSSRRKNLEDASYITWDRWMSREDFKMKYPKYSDRKIDEMMETGRGGVWDVGVPYDKAHTWDSTATTETDELNEYSRPLDFNFYDRSKNMVRVIHMEYWESYKRYFAFDPKTGKWQEFESKKLKDIKAAYAAEFNDELVYETLMDKKVKWLQFTGDEILFDDDSPMPYPGFSILPLIAYKDASNRTINHYGLVRLIKDPQKEINKRWSQALNMLNQQVQPGVYAETDAFVDIEQAKLSLKEPGAITFVENGALSTGKLKERELPTFPNAPMQMEQFSQDIMKKITGINTDLLGQDSGRQEAGVVVRMRQQQGLTILKPLYKASNNMKKGAYKRVISIIVEYMSDEQILRILGEGERYTIDSNTGVITDQTNNRQAELRDIRSLQYNVKAEESPGNFTKRMLEMQTYMEMLQAGMPVDPRVIIERTDLPQDEKIKWFEYIDRQEQSQSQAQQDQVETEKQFKDREISVDEQANLIDLITATMKVKQQEAKDNKKAAAQQSQLQSSNALAVAKLESDENKNVADTVLEVLKMIEAKNQGGQQGAEGKETKPKSA